ncbi:hypothetical protein [uncultured Desulfovibrio sp.]|uniref:hypothetical protein n=1 Tax=uncultured Desulfovibrio sp. TaxID=167968 RepID=UPI0026717E61|nr:hypothetical protein [uncultured Desulfovibrio sp.]
MYEYDPNKASMSRLRRSYELNDHEAEIVMAKLWPHSLFPLELWRKAHDLCWSGFANSVALYYSVKSPEFPEHDVTEEKYFHAHLYAQDMERLFSMLASRIHVNALREGFRYILSMTYENIDKIAFKEKMDFMFDKLSTIEENNGYIFTQRLSNEKFEALMEEKIFSFPPSGYFFISKMYPDTILVDTVSAIRCLYYLNIPYKKESKGIPRSLVESVINALKEEETTAAISTPQPQKQPQARPSTGSRKDTERINATRQVCEQLLEELLQERQAFENNRNTWKPSLLNHINGMTNWKIFYEAAAARLGDKPHRDAAREVWEKVSDNFKHDGRMPE